MNYAETDCNTEIEENFLAVILWISRARIAGNRQISAAFPASPHLSPTPKSRY
jgi:hypothetical protein